MADDGLQAVVSIAGQRSFKGELSVPGDKSISHRALLISALSSGASTIRGLSIGKDVQATKAAIIQLGAKVSARADQLIVEGGPDILRHPAGVINVGNSGTLIRLAAGMTAGLGGRYTFSGDESVNSRPMKRIFAPLMQMGAEIEASNNGETAPFTLHSHGLHGIRYEMPVASAQVKSSILLAGLGATGITTVVEKIPTRRHSEEMLLEAGAQLEVVQLANQTEISIERSHLKPINYDIPGDPSQAAFWLVAALILPDSEVTVRNIYLGDLRSDFLTVLRRMGADLTINYISNNSGDVSARSSQLNSTTISPDEIPGLIDEIPIISVAAAHASGTTVITGATELRVKESDRITVMAAALRSFGVEIKELPDGMEITGGGHLRHGTVSAHLDHRIAMSSSVMAATVEGVTEINGFDSVESSYPDFLAHFEQLTNH
ncbi:MAG: 3-phosphoshikimate 1-carboxyvinyltransferase [Acidimicrobiaceae bacterium]|nr:3-phosphoshikimate 1-carboxyvinyltransferase [Acidimicrobiaceae bacterium]